MLGRRTGLFFFVCLFFSAKHAKTRGKQESRLFCPNFASREKSTHRPPELIKFPMPPARHENKRNPAMHTTNKNETSNSIAFDVGLRGRDTHGGGDGSTSMCTSRKRTSSGSKTRQRMPVGTSAPGPEPERCGLVRRRSSSARLGTGCFVLAQFHRVQHQIIARRHCVSLLLDDVIHDRLAIDAQGLHARQ